MTPITPDEDHRPESDDPATDDVRTDDPRELVALGSRVLGEAGLGDLIWGHLSVRSPDGRGIWMKASTYGFEEIDPSRTVLVARSGDVLEGEGPRHAEFPIHTEIMAVRDDVNAVVHNHSPAAVAFGATGLPLRPISHEGTYFVPPDLPRFTETGDLILTVDLGQRLAHCLGQASAVLMVNHGVAVVGPDVPTAVVASLLLDRACEMQLRTMSAARDLMWSSDEEALSKRDNCYSPRLLHQAWAYLVRRLEPGMH